MKILSATFLVLASVLTYSQEAIQEGSNVSDLILLDTEGKEVSLRAFQGKYLFVDFWFKQCKGCVQEFPDAAKMKSALKEENILFVNISTDFSEEFWRTGMEENNLNGVNLWTGGFARFKSGNSVIDFNKKLGFNTFPRY